MNYSTAKRFVLAASAIGALSIAGGVPAKADSVSDFFHNRTITVVVPAGPAGSFHLIAQLVARHLGEHIPGHPTLITQNRPGAGGITASNYMAQAAPRDGTVIAEMNPGTVIMPLLREVKFDPRQFPWLGVFTVRTYTIGVWHTVKYSTLDELRKHQVIMGSSGVGSLNYQFPLLMNVVLGTKFKVITGYKGGGAINLAMERGEVQGRGNFYSGYTAAKPTWLRDGLVRLLFTLGPRRPEVAKVPRLRPLFPKGEARQMYDLLEVAFNIGQAFHLPPGVPHARVVALQNAFQAMLKDPALIADTKKHHLPLMSRDAQYAQKVVDDAFKTPPEIARKLAHILGMDQSTHMAKKKKS